MDCECHIMWECRKHRNENTTDTDRENMFGVWSQS